MKTTDLRQELEARAREALHRLEALLAVVEHEDRPALVAALGASAFLPQPSDVERFGRESVARLAAEALGGLTSWGRRIGSVGYWMLDGSDVADQPADALARALGERIEAVVTGAPAPAERAKELANEIRRKR
jgi:hypothetical protein